MLGLAQSGKPAEAPRDQFGRLTFTFDMANAIFHLLTTHAEYGTYNMTGSGKVASWYDIAKIVYETAGADISALKANSVEEYVQNTHGALRPRNCSLDLSKLESTGYAPVDWEEALHDYLQKEIAK